MKMNCWLILGTMLSGGLLAQPATNPPTAAPIETPAAAPMATNDVTTPTPTNAPPAKAAKKKRSGKKKAMAELKTVPLTPGMAEVVATHVNVRGQARLKSEVVTRVNKGDQVMVIEEVVRNNSGPDEPSAWAKILLPTGAHVWAYADYIDATNSSVRASKLNLRSGPGENYSVLGHLQRGDAVKQLNTKGKWVEIESPTNVFAFVAAQYLKQETPAATNAEPIASTAPVNEPPTVATAPGETPVMPAPGDAAATTNVPATAAVEEPPKPRIVEREGIVRGMTSIQAPSHFELISPDNGKAIDYLYTTSPELDLRRYKGLKIIVTGEEGLDERWQNTPVLTIQKIQVVE